jgi:hypothetical protein
MHKQCEVDCRHLRDLISQCEESFQYTQTDISKCIVEKKGAEAIFKKVINMTTDAEIKLQANIGEDYVRVKLDAAALFCGVEIEGRLDRLIGRCGRLPATMSVLDVTHCYDACSKLHRMIEACKNNSPRYPSHKEVEDCLVSTQDAEALVRQIVEILQHEKGNDNCDEKYKCNIPDVPTKIADMNPNQKSRCFRQLSRFYHPDKTMTESAEDQQQLQHCYSINESDLLRARVAEYTDTGRDPTIERVAEYMNTDRDPTIGRDPTLNNIRAIKDSGQR